MKVLIGGIAQETNMFTPERTRFADFRQLRGEALFEHIPSASAFRDRGFETIPAVFAYSTPAGPLSKAEFALFVDEFLGAIPDDGVDGVYLSLHGAMHVTDIGSGEEYLIRALRERLGSHVPISASFDFHGNLKTGITDNLNFATAYRTAPHTDMQETQARAVNALIRMLEAKLLPKVSMQSIPLSLPGEMVITADFPANSIIERLSALIDGCDVWDVSLFCGFVWADNDYMTMSVAYSFLGEEADIKQRVAAETEYIWSQREAFGFSVEAYEPDHAVQIAKEVEKGIVFISDSGDNVTAGAAGDSACMLRHVLQAGMERTLIGGICDAEVLKLCAATAIGQTLRTTIGGTIDPSSEKVEITAVLRDKGTLDADQNVCYARLAVGSVDILVTSLRYAFTCPDDYRKANVDILGYRTVIIKLGYLFPLLAPLAARSILALTKGSSNLKIDRIHYVHGGDFYPAKQVSFGGQMMPE